MRGATHPQSDQGAEKSGDGECEQSALVVSGEVFGVAHPVGTEEAAEHAKSVHGGDSSGHGFAFKKRGRDGIERTKLGCEGDGSG